MLNEQDETQTHAEASKSAQQPVVMCKIEDAFAFFGACLVDDYEHLFSGGENEIAEISYRFQEAFTARLDKYSAYHSDDIIHRLQFKDGKPVTHQGT